MRLLIDAQTLVASSPELPKNLNNRDPAAYPRALDVVHSCAVMNEQLRRLIKQLIRKTRSKHAVWHSTRQRQEFACYMQSGLVLVDRYRNQSGAEVCDMTIQSIDGASVVYLSTDNLESAEDRQLLDELHRTVEDRVLNISGTLQSMLMEIENSSDVGFNDPPV